MRMGGKHDRKMLVLLYKMAFQSKYPANEYNIIIEPRVRPIADIYYIPDILITKEDRIIYWIEVGALEYEKARTLIEYLGKERFLHIPSGDNIFKLEYSEDASKICPDPLSNEPKNHTDFEQTFRKHEVEMIEKALIDNKWNTKLAARQIELTDRQIRYKMEKYGISRHSIAM